MMMEIEKVNQQESHNLLLTTFLPSQQIAHLAFASLDASKLLLHNNTELRFLSGLAAATSNILKLYSLYDNATALEVGSWRLHEDIIGVVGWDRLIVVSTAQKVVGFKYEAGLLKNAFLISLQFLQLDPHDTCSVFADRLGHVLVIHVRNYLLICFSEKMAGKYKGRVMERVRLEMVSEQARWSEPGRNHVLDMVKIKLIDLQINKVEQIQILDDSIYFIGHKNREKVLYCININSFFQSNQSSPLVNPVPNKDQPPANTKVLVYHSHQRTNISYEFLYYNTLTSSLSLKLQHTTYEVGTFQGKLQIFHQGNAFFPLLVWQKERGRFSIIEKYKTFQENYQFRVKQLVDGCFAETIIFREGLAILASKSAVILLTPNGQKKRIHQSLGNIIDFHMGRDMLVVQNSQRKLTRLYELTKGPRVDPKPFVTHKKKMFLENLSDLIAIYSFLLGQKALQILAVRRGTGNNKFYTLYREGQTQFECLLEEIVDYEEASINGEKVLLVQSKSGSNLVMASQQGIKLEPFQWSGWKMVRRWCQSNYLIAYDQQRTWVFYNIATGIERRVEVNKGKAGEVGAFVQFRRTTYDRTLKDHDLVQIYFIYQKQLEIWLLDLVVGVPSLIHVTGRLSEGAPVLSNQLVFPDSYKGDAYRSTTCPQYNLNQHGLKTMPASQGNILSAYLYQGDQKTLLILVSSEECILIYRKYFSVEDGGFIFRRVNTPLSIVKNFKWTGDKSFLDLGQGLVKLGNVMVYKGELVESIPTRSLFRMQGVLWGLLSESKIRLIHLGSDVYEGFCIRQIECGISEGLMGIDSTSQFYCAYSRKGFEIFNKDFTSHWRCTLGNQNIVCLRMFQHYVGMSYYDYYCDEEGVNDYNSVRFRFRIYNCATKNKIIEREKPLDQPILHIRYMAPDKLILVTSSLIFVNILKNDKTLQLYRTHNFNSKRSFLSAFAYIPDILPAGFGQQGSPGYMLFGGSHGGLGFFVGKWIQEEKLKEQWFEGFRCGIRQVTFFHFGEERDELLKALVADEDGNLIVLTLKVDHAQKVADIRLGSPVNTFKSKSGNERAVYCSMGDGSIKLLTAVRLDGNQVSYLDFQKSFCDQLPFYGGFNLRTSRRLQQKYRSGRLVSRGNIVDGDILQSFFSLTSTLRRFVLNSSDMDLLPLKSILPF